MPESPGYIKNLKSESVVQRVIDCLTEAMVSRQLKPGDKLPPEPELAAAFGVARTSVREAIKILTYLGVLESRRSEGTFVISGFQESMIDPMVYGIILNQGEDFESLMELREMTEAGILRLAIRKWGPEKLAFLRERLSRMERLANGADTDLEAFFQADDDFHNADSSFFFYALADKINRVVRVLTYAVRHHTVETMIRSGRVEELVQAHRRIYEALESRDAEGLEEIIRNTYFLEVARKQEREEAGSGKKEL